MKQKELVKQIAAESGISAVEAGRVFKAALKVIAGNLRRQEPVSIRGFGTFTVSGRKARSGRNPLTGAQMLIPARKIVKFTPGTELRF